MTDTPTENAFVLGIDGVPWDLLHEWATAGELPNFQRLVTDGAAAPLKSTTPPTTPLAWPSIATGTRPDKHGIYAFHDLEGSYSRRMNTAANVKRPALWDVMSPAAVGNVPMTYPADDIDGRMVTGMMSPGMDDGFTHPPELATEIEQKIPDYEIGLDWFEYADDPDQFVDDIDDLVTARRRLMNLLAEGLDWRLFFFVYTAPDRLQHLIWDEDVILDHYRTLDDVLGDAMALASERDATLYVVSDHGFGPISKVVHLNTLLEKGGFLSRKDDDGARSSLAKLGLTKSTVLNSLDRVGVSDEALVRHLPQSIVDGVAERIPGNHDLYDVDFDNTVAFAYGPGHVYVNDVDRFENGIVHPSEVDSIKRSVTSVLSQATDPETGDRVLEVSDGDDLFPTDSASPDLIAIGHGAYEEKTKLSDDVFEPTGAKAAGHRSQGVFFAWGPDVAAGATADQASVFDVAPTVLHGAGEPIPEAADGRVLEEIFAAGSDSAERFVTTRAYGGTTATPDANVDENFDDVEDRLRGLGYLD